MKWTKDFYCDLQLGLPSPGRATDFQQAQAKIGALAKLCATASGS